MACRHIGDDVLAVAIRSGFEPPVAFRDMTWTCRRAERPPPASALEMSPAAELSKLGQRQHILA